MRSAGVEVWARRAESGGLDATPDAVALEEPLEIRLAAGGERRTLAVTMRTPGDDVALAAGFLHGEGLVRDRALISGLRTLVEEDPDSGARSDVVEVELAARRLPNLRSLERHVFTGSACGVCGRVVLDEHLVGDCRPPAPGPAVAAETLDALPGTLRAAQEGFAATGGLHAAALFTPDGTLLAAAEDVGRHNALDKLIGRELLEGRLGPERALERCTVLVSGRASFELVQKALAAGVPILCAVSAPTSLAVEVAGRFGMTLVGFLREGRFNVYCGRERIAG
ncbi:MAG: formate dehydrogenase accessory sulfurtransferase FdhD [Thermoanaerobaculia bacterium]